MAVLETVMISCSFQTIIVLIFMFLLASRFLKFNQMPPGPRGWPVIGSLLHIGSDPYLTFDKWTRIYGDIFTVQLGWNNAVVLNSVNVIKRAIRDKGDKFTDRPSLPLVELGFTIPGSIAFDNGHTWSERRRWSFSAIRNFCFGRQDLGHRVNLENKVNVEAGYLCLEIDEHGDSFDPFYFINNAVSNIVCAVSFGDRYEYSDPKFKELINGIRFLFKEGSFLAPANIVPWLFHTPMYNEFRNVTSSIKVFIDDIIERHLETFDGSDIRDIIDAYIVESQKDDVDPKVFSKDILWRSIFDLFNAGTDTTSSTIMWIIVYLLNYSEVQKKVHKEIDDVLGQEKTPSWDDRHCMPYLQAVILEVQRLSNVVPMSIRSTTEEVDINGYKIPPGTQVFMNFWSAHHQTDYWERQSNFEPERFLTDDHKIKNYDGFMPFGLGGRSCIGDLMAKMQLFLFMANLLQRFTFKVPEGRDIPSVSEYLPGLTRCPKPFQVCAVKH